MAAIVQDGDPVLRETAQAVPKELFGSERLFGMLRDMEEALDKEADGVALAAPQIALPYRIFIVRYDRMAPSKEGAAVPPPEVGVYINPEIIKTSKRKVQTEEGCLSVRGLYGKTKRHERVSVRAYDARGKPFERGGGGILAQAFAHEIEHLNGILFVDHATHLRKIERRAHAPFVFFGTPNVARETLALLHERGFMPSLVVTSPDAPKGRGLAVAPSETKEWAESNTVPVITPETLDNEALRTITAETPSYGIVVAYGKKLPKKILDAFPLGVLNIHYSLLPKYRGASPVETALLNGETETGVTIQIMNERIDEGDIVAQKGIVIDKNETAREVRARLIPLGAQLLADILPLFEAGALVPIKQDEKQATYAGKIKKEDGLLDLSGDSRTNWNTYRAYAESPGTYFFVHKNGKRIRVKIKTARFENGTFVPERIVPEGKKEMNYDDFRRV